jgi:hypothetical protein
VTDVEHRVVVGGHHIGEAPQVRPRVGAEHRVSRKIVGVVGGQIQRGVECLLQIGSSGFDALLADRT